MLIEDDIFIIKFLRKKYFCKFIDVIRFMILVGIMKGLISKKKKVVGINRKVINDEFKKENYIKLYEFIMNNNGIYIKVEIIKNKNFFIYLLNKLIDKEILKVEE